MTSKRNIPARRFIKPSFNFLIEKKRAGQFRAIGRALAISRLPDLRTFGRR